MYAFCPKLGQPQRTEKKFLGFCKQTYCFEKQPFLKEDEVCSNPFQGQEIIMLESAIVPYVHLPEIFGNEELTGYAINFLKYMARRLQFSPTYKNAPSGLPRGNTFTPGKYRDVNVNLCNFIK